MDKFIASETMNNREGESLLSPFNSIYIKGEVLMYNPANWYRPTEDQIYHLVYLTTNLINGKIYVGKHSTYDCDDLYLGSGVALKPDVKSLGKHNFKRVILHFCLTEKESLKLESFIVDKDFVDREDTYNILLGGGETSSRCGITVQFSEEHLINIRKCNC